MNLELLLSDLRSDEGFIPHAYQDSLGFWTIGYGTLIDKRGGGISQMEADFLLQNRVQKFIGALDAKFPWFKRMTDARQRAVANMAYQMGIDGLSRFKNMLSAMERGDYPTAADEALNSAWAKQTPERALRVSRMMRVG